MVIQGKRAIAYFDILGFKAKVENMPVDELAHKYEEIVRQTDGEFTIQDGKIASKQVCHRYIFSDSIFLIAEEDTEESFMDLVFYAWRMMQMFIAAGFPLRGAITYGDIYVNFEKNIFLGSAISDAAVLEGKQDWIGAVVDTSAIGRYRTVFEKSDVYGFLMNTLLPIYDVPFKDGMRRNCSVINWRHNIVSQDGIKALFKNEPFNEAVQVKIDNALQFSKEIREARMAYANVGNIPGKYRKLYIGHVNPQDDSFSFSHGDEY